MEIRKTDMVTGEELPGAKLTLLDANGQIVDQWISDKTPHVIRKKLTAGAWYTLREEQAPNGYLLAEEVVFKVSLDGRIDRVVMEDRRKEETDRPENSDEPSVPTIPEIPVVPEIPDEAESHGYIIAKYEANVVKGSTIRVLRPTGVVAVNTPKTGDTSLVNAAVIGMLISMIGLLLLYFERRRKENGQN